MPAPDNSPETIEAYTNKINSQLDKSRNEGKIVFKDYAVEYTLNHPRRPIVFTYDNMLTCSKDIETRSGWGFAFLKKNRYNVVSFLTRSPDWYRLPEFKAIINAINKSGFKLSRYPRRIAYGSSMGAYAAATFGDKLRCEDRILFHPISTLNRSLVPWESRRFTRKTQNWNGPYNDAVKGCRKAKNVFIFVDNLFRLDYQHCKRFLQNGNVTVLKCAGLGHGIPNHFITLGIFKNVILPLLNRNLNKEKFHKIIRKRRSLGIYYDRLLSVEFRKDTLKRKTILLAHQRRHPKGGLTEPDKNTQKLFSERFAFFLEIFRTTKSN